MMHDTRRGVSRPRSGSTRSASSVQRPPTFACIPFGGGTRRCVGAAFANVEMDVVLRTVLRHFVIEHDHRARREGALPRRGVHAEGRRPRGDASPHHPAQRRLAGGRRFPLRQLPARPREVAGVAVRDTSAGSPGARARPPRSRRPASTSVTTLPGHSPEASTSAMVSWATRFCSSSSVEDRRAVAAADGRCPAGSCVVGSWIWKKNSSRSR